MRVREGGTFHVAGLSRPISVLAGLGGSRVCRVLLFVKGCLPPLARTQGSSFRVLSTV